MFKTAGLIASTFLLVSCSFYSSAGRKQFEEKAPSQIQAQAFTQSLRQNEPQSEMLPRNFVVQSCRNFTATELWLHSEFSQSHYEILELTDESEIWKNTRPDGQVEIVRIIKSDSGAAESCVYLFSSLQSWSEQQNAFLSEAATKTSEVLD